MSLPSRPRVPARAGTDPREGRLESWKQIASYLHRDVRSVQRWEQSEGLPVHRHQHHRRGTVFAWREELDAWLEQRTQSPVPPAPEVPEEPVPRATPEASAAPRRLALFAVLGVVLVAALATWWSASPARAPRLIVLPFQTLGEEEVGEPLAQGLLEEIITGLSSIDPELLVVLGRTSSLHFAGSQRRPADIGGAVDATYLIEGSIRRQGSDLRVTTRLLRVEGETPVWTATHTLDTRDLFRTERTLTAAIARAVEKEVLGREGTLREVTQAGVAPEAYDAWLRGRYLFHKANRAGLDESLEYFTRALELEPDFVAARVGLAQAHALLGRYGMRPPQETFPKAREAALRALELDPASAGAHTVLALVLFYYDWDFSGAAQQFRTAISHAPGQALAHHGYASFLSAMGLHEEALASVRVARELEPMWPLVNSDEAWFYYRAHRFEEAIGACRRTLELEPDFFSALSCLVSSLERVGRPEEAWEILFEYLDRNELAGAVGVGQDTLPEIGLQAYGDWECARIEEASERTYVAPFSQVFTRTGTGRDEEVLHWLAEAVRTRDRVALLMAVHPALDEVRGDPRFQALLEQVGMPADPRDVLSME